MTYSCTDLADDVFYHCVRNGVISREEAASPDLADNPAKQADLIKQGINRLIAQRNARGSPEQPVPKASTPRKRVKVVCAKCGSDDVRADAYAAWSVETQSWELTATFDKGSVCENCGGETRLKEQEILFTTKDCDRLLGLADQFLENWADDAKGDKDSESEYAERSAEWVHYRPLLENAAEMFDVLNRIIEAGGGDIYTDDKDKGPAVVRMTDAVSAADRLLESIIVETDERVS